MLNPHISFDALGTRWWIDLPNEDQELKNKIIHKVTDFESKYSRFKDTSQLYKLNKAKKFHNPSPEFVALLNYGLKMYKETDGLFNMSVGAQLESDGYGKITTKGAAISRDLINDVKFSSQKVELSPKTTLDFGGFGKGWLVDEIGKIIKKHGIKDFIINGGGDILVGDELQEILIEHPLKPGYSIEKVTLKNQSLASSSALKRTWKNKDNVLKTHIISPDGQVESDIVSMHLIASSALLADTLATVFSITDEITRQKLSNKFSVKFLSIVN